MAEPVLSLSRQMPASASNWWAAIWRALIIINPGGSGALEPALLLALAGSALMALAQLVLKKMSQRDGTDTLVARNLILTVPLALIPAIFVWTTPD